MLEGGSLDGALDGSGKLGGLGGGLRSGAPALGNISKFASVAGIIEDFSRLPNFEGMPDRSWHWRYELARRQRIVVNKSDSYWDLKRLCVCSRFPVPKRVKRKDGEWVETGSPGRIEAHWYGKGREDEASGKNNPLGYVWVQKCANPLSCFVCAPKIRLFRGLELKAACEAIIKKPCWSWFFLTLTAPHDWQTEAGPQIKAFQEAARRFKSGRWWQDFKDRWGIKDFHQIKAVELTADAPWSEKPTGIHWHSHSICFYERDGEFAPGEAAIMQSEAQARWVQCLKGAGIPIRSFFDALNIGLRLELPRKPKNNGSVVDAVNQAADYLSLGAVIEIAPGVRTKVTHREDRVTHWQFMELALTKYPYLQTRMVAVLKALKGRHWLHWTPGLKELCGLEDVSDEDIMKEHVSLPMADFKGDVWGFVDDRKAQSRVMAAVCEEVEREVDVSVPASVFEDDDALYARYKAVVRDAFVSVVRILVDGYDPLTGEELLE